MRKKYFGRIKLLLTCFLCLFAFATISQSRPRHIIYNNSDYLVATNGKHTKKYHAGQLLKVFYIDSVTNQLTKAKGRMYVINQDEIKIIPFAKKDIVSVQLHTIRTIGIWARPAKILTAINAGAGLVAVGIALLLETSNSSESAGNILLFVPVAIAVADLYYVGISIPVIILRELISRRSVIHGYRFYVEDTSVQLYKVGK